jgi:hypothetical protein
MFNTDPKIHWVMRGFGYSIIISSYFIALATFMIAYFSPDKKVLIDINVIGEANLEFFVFLITLPFAIGVIVSIYKKIRNERTILFGNKKVD